LAKFCAVWKPSAIIVAPSLSKYVVVDCAVYARLKYIYIYIYIVFETPIGCVYVGSQNRCCHFYCGLYIRRSVNSSIATFNIGIIDVYVGGQQPSQATRIDSNVLHGQFQVVTSKSKPARKQMRVANDVKLNDVNDPRSL
jgi:hypothetical protein